MLCLSHVARRKAHWLSPALFFSRGPPQTWRDKWMNGQGRCIQGNHTEDTHRGDLGYAFDFKLRPGTKVGLVPRGRSSGFVWAERFLREDIFPSSLNPL